MKEYSRILLKLSGEALQGSNEFGIDPDAVKQFASQINAITRRGVEVVVVLGGGNIFRGLQGMQSGVSRVKGDQMGMLATVINSMALQSGIENEGGEAQVFTSVRMEPFAEFYVKERAQEALQSGKVAIIAGGTGNPYFTTDSAAALRALEIEADVLLKGTRVDGIYSDDPEKNKDAVRYEKITYNEALEKRLNVMDMTAFALCRDNDLPVIVFNVIEPGNLQDLLSGKDIGTMVY
ncbi:MAG: UMP kinase [Bacteroidota bacterium]